MASKSWNDWKFQIHQNKLERVHPRIHIEGNNTFFVSTRKFCLKENDKIHNGLVIQN